MYEQTQWYPTNFNMLQYLFCPYGGLTLEYDRFGAVYGEKDGKLTWDTLTLGITGAPAPGEVAAGALRGAGGDLQLSQLP